jgi:hypothetical protein
MGYNQVKSLVGWIIILGHFALAGVAFATLRRYLSIGEIVDVLLVMSPITLAYVVSVIRHFLAAPFEKSRGRKVNGNFVGVAVFIPLALIVLIGAFFFLYGHDVVANVSQLQRWVAGVEAVLGATVGMVVAELFPTANSPEGA